MCLTIVLFADYRMRIKFYNLYMKFFKYTNLLLKKIKHYDEITKEPYFSATNPFAKPREIKIIWVDGEKEQ